MIENKVILKARGKEDVEVRLYREHDHWNEETMLSVYADEVYKFCLDIKEREEVIGITLYINDEKYGCAFGKNNTLVFIEQTATGIYKSIEKNVFRNRFGFVQIRVEVDTFEDKRTYISPLLEVIVKDSKENKSIQKMMSYISSNHANCLGKGGSGSVFKRGKEQETLIDILYEIVYEYEGSFKSFKENSKGKSVQTNSVDTLEKLRYISSDTVHHITRHPEELREVNYNSGIEYNGGYYQPMHTLVQTPGYSHDIYENRIVVGFLATLVREIEAIRDNIEQEDSQAEGEENYVSSIEYLHKGAKEQLRGYKDKLYDIEDQLQGLYFLYKGILNVKEESVDMVPMQTEIFFDVIHYNRIFNIILKWFEYGEYELEKEKFLLGFKNESTVYECYVLLKLNQYLQKQGYELKESKKHEYELHKKALYTQAMFENIFSFKKGEDKITVYYEPVIHADKIWNDKNNIGLFRNTSLGFIGKEENAYYSPDYLIKIEKEGKVSYVIMDAKWASREKVVQDHAQEFAFKYIVSLSTINENESIEGVCLITARDERGICGASSVYNSTYSMRNTTIKPCFEMISLSEDESNDLNNKESMHNIELGKVLRKYI